MRGNAADFVILGGTVVTGTAGYAQAVAVTAGIISGVGSEDEVLALRGAGTEVVDLHGATLLPGLIEPHTHPDLSAQCYAMADVSGFSHSSAHEVEASLRRSLAAVRKGEWVFAFGLDPMLTPDLGVWDRHRLDALAPLNAVVVMLQSMHTVFVNSAALRAAGIEDDTPDPEGGGHFLRDGEGHLTGAAVEQPAINAFMRFFDQSVGTWKANLRAQYRRYRDAGITTVGIAGLFVPEELMPAFESVTREAPVRAVAYLHQRDAGSSTLKPGDGDDRLRYQGVKFWYDGSPYSGTMLLDEPYLESPLACHVLGIAPGTRGQANFEPIRLLATLKTLREQGWQVITHVQGDRGSREILDVYEQALAGNRNGDHRWRLEHCALISERDIDRAARLGVALSFHVNHVRYYGPELRDAIIGRRRADRLMPLATALRRGHRISLHADSPMYPAAPLDLVRTAVTRRMRTGEQLAPDEGISVEQALRAVTIDAAWQLFADDRLGSIENGKLADFTIVDRNPLAIPAERLDEIEILGTWSGGRPTEA